MQRLIQSVLAAAILLGTAATTRAESVMKQCGEQWQAAKAAGTTSGATWPQFLAQCRTQLGSGAATAAPTPAAVQPQTGSLFPWQQPASPPPAPTASTTGGNQSVMRQCGAQWQAAKAAGTTGGATWPQFLKACRGQLASTTSAPQGGFAPAAPAPAPAPSASAHAIGFTVSVAAASRSACWERRVDRSRVGAGSSVSLSRIDGRLGQ